MTDPVPASEGTRVILVRHGQTEWNAAHRVQGQTDIPLDALGRWQAERLAGRLSGERIDAVHTSDLSRARETARPIAAERGLTVHEWSELREMRYGPWEGLTVGEIEASYPEEYLVWRRDRLRFRLDGIETLEALRDRALVAGRQILAAHDGQTITIVGHGGTSRALLCALLGWPVAVSLQLRMDNVSVSRLEYTARGPVLVLYNDISHLASALDEPAF